MVAVLVAVPELALQELVVVLVAVQELVVVLVAVQELVVVLVAVQELVVVLVAVQELAEERTDFQTIFQKILVQSDFLEAVRLAAAVAAAVVGAYAGLVLVRRSARLLDPPLGIS